MYCTQAKKPFSGIVVKCDGPKIKTNILRRRAAIKTHLPAWIFSFPDSNELSSFTLFIKQNWLVVFSPTLQKPLRTVETMFEERQKVSYHGKQTKWTYCNNIVVRNSHVFNGKNIRRLLCLMQRYRKLLSPNKTDVSINFNTLAILQLLKDFNNIRKFYRKRQIINPWEYGLIKRVDKGRMLLPWNIWKAYVSSVSPSSKRIISFDI